MSVSQRWRRRLGAGAALVVLLSVAPPAPASAEQPVPGEPPNPAGAATDETEVTLITGDVVRVAALPTGGYQPTPQPAARPPGSPPVVFQTLRTPAGDVYVIPSDAQPAVGSGRLDLELFNIRRLVEERPAGAGGSLPVIVRYAEPAAPAALASTTDALPGTVAAARPLPSIDGAAVRLATAALPDFWARLGSPQASARHPVAAAVESISLDGMATVTLDESVPQVGAPAAWQAGLDGTGVTVAVLDTGIDDRHPDLAGKVAVAENFLGDGPPADGHGHGTHVAATVAGSGAASDGQFTGVAPGATLISGKVCDDAGQCPNSAIIAGMQWAAVEQDADIISMSLGGGQTDGTDPLSQAVNQLTAETGALFVIAAGNSGAGGSGTVESPGTADAALTVGAVDKSDQLAGFSSRGPRVGDLALKPELTAPGVAIAAARAGGSDYVAMSGTSMATPHVSGAAAILAQQHPDWSPEQLKAALVTSAAELPDRSVFQVGNGRLDVARGIGLPLLASPPVVDFGLATPSEPAPPRTVTFTNPGTSARTVELTADLRDQDGAAAGDRVQVTPAALTIPAGGTAQATVALDAAGAPLGQASGAVRVRETAGTELLRLPIAAVNEHWHRVPVQVLPPPAPAPAPAPSTVTLARVDAPGRPVLVPLDPDTHTGHAFLPEGSYLAVAGSGYLAPDGAVVQVLLIDPEVAVDGSGPVVLDGGAVREVTVSGQRPTELLNLTLAITRGSGQQSDGVWQVTASAGEALGRTPTRLMATPTAPVQAGSFQAVAQAELAQSTLELQVAGDGPVLDASYAHHHLAQPQTDLTDTFELVDVGQGSPEEVAGVDLTGRLALVALPPPPPPFLTNVNLQAVEVWQRLREAGAVGAVAYGLLERPTWIDRLGMFWPRERPVAETAVPVYVVGTDDGADLRERVAQRLVSLSVHSQVEPDYLYTLRLAADRLPDPPTFQAPPDRELVRSDSRYHAAGPMDVRRVLFSTSPDGEVLRTDSWLSGGSARTELIGPVDPEVLWWRTATGHDPAVLPFEFYYGNDGYRQTSFDVWTGPDRIDEGWFDGPAVPGGGSRTQAVLDLLSRVDTSTWGDFLSSPPLEICHACRGEHLFLTPSAGWGRSHHWSWLPTLRGTEAHLFRDGQEIPPPSATFPRWQMPDDPAPHQYRLTHLVRPQAGLEQPFLRQAAEVRTSWDFWSRTPTGDEPEPQRRCLFTGTPCRTESLLLVDYGFGQVLSPDNTARRSGVARLPVTVYQQPGAAQSRVTQLRAQVSYNSGEHWLPLLALPRGDGRYELLVLHPPRLLSPGDTVSLRMTARDSAGNQVEQTILDAYPLAGRG